MALLTLVIVLGFAVSARQRTGRRAPVDAPSGGRGATLISSGEPLSLESRIFFGYRTTCDETSTSVLDHQAQVLATTSTKNGQCLQMEGLALARETHMPSRLVLSWMTPEGGEFSPTGLVVFDVDRRMLVETPYMFGRDYDVLPLSGAVVWKGNPDADGEIRSFYVFDPTTMERVEIGKLPPSLSYVSTYASNDLMGGWDPEWDLDLTLEKDDRLRFKVFAATGWVPRCGFPSPCSRRLPVATVDFYLEAGFASQEYPFAAIDPKEIRGL